MDAQYGGGTASHQAKVTIPDILAATRAGRKITMMTAYDTLYPATSAVISRPTTSANDRLP